YGVYGGWGDHGNFFQFSLAGGIEASFKPRDKEITVGVWGGPEMALVANRINLQTLGGIWRELGEVHNDQHLELTLYQAFEWVPKDVRHPRLVLFWMGGITLYSFLLGFENDPINGTKGFVTGATQEFFEGHTHRLGGFGLGGPEWTRLLEFHDVPLWLMQSLNAGAEVGFTTWMTYR